MKKILTILVALGLTATTGTTVVACSHQNDGDHPVNAQTTTVDFHLTTPTKKGDLLTTKDQQGLHDEIINQLKTANSKANVNDQTFEVDLSHLTPEFTSIEVKVNQTGAANGKPGINAGTIDVQLNLTNPDLTSIDPLGCDIYFELESTKNKTLTKSDQDKLQTKVLQELVDANQGASNVRASSFTISTDLSKVTSATSTLEVRVNKTKTDGHLPGLKNGNVNVQLALEPQLLDLEDAHATDLEFELTKTHLTDEKIAEEDQVLLRQAIERMLKDNNQNRVIEKNTFVFDLTTLSPISHELTIIVNRTKSTVDTPGLREGSLTIGLALNPLNLDSVPVQGTSIEKFKLTETHQGEVLTKNDQTLLQVAIVDALMKANEDAVTLPSIFEFDLSDIKQNTPKIEVTVASTDSTVETPGLLGGKVDVELDLISANPEPITAKGTNVSVDLQETHLGQTLTENDQKTVRQAILDALKTINAGAVCDDNTFDVASLDLSQLTPETANQIYVKVNATKSSADKAGLIEDTVTVYLALKPLY